MSKPKVAVVTGITGQDGSYLAELLLGKGYEVIGIARRSSTDTHYHRLDGVMRADSFKLVIGDVTDASSMASIVSEYRPDELYNLAAQSFVKDAFDQPNYTWQVNAQGVLNILEAIRKYSPQTRMYQASTSEMFGRSYSVWCPFSAFSNDAPKNVSIIQDFNMDDAPPETLMEECGQPFQNEQTPFQPQSPYSIGKAAAHYAMQLYRRTYNLHLSCGILFNHECFKYDYPFVIKHNGIVQIRSIEDIAKEYAGFDSKNNNRQGVKPLEKLEVWDENGWTKIKHISWFRNIDKSVRLVNSRNSIYCISDDHKCIKDNGEEIRAKDIKVSDKVKLIDSYKYQLGTITFPISIEDAELIGMIVGDGSVSKSKHFTNKCGKLRDRFKFLWEKCTGGTAKYYPSKSGFTNKEVGRLDLTDPNSWLKGFDFYSSSRDVFGHKYKQVPKQILNCNCDIMEAFLVGYNNCDGLKKNGCRYKFRNFKTNSPILTAGLVYLINNVTKQQYNLTLEESWRHGKQQFYYSINLLSDRQKSLDKYNRIMKLKEVDWGISQREIHRQTGISRGFIRKVIDGYVPSNTHHLEKPKNEVKKIITCDEYTGFLFDLETESNTIHAAIGDGLVHNSERRGKQFVTRKITDWVARFYHWKKQFEKMDNVTWVYKDLRNIRVFRDGSEIGNFPKLALGNLDSKRDWGHAKDYCVNLNVPILTTDGWKFYDDISVGDTVINFDIEKNCLSTDIVNKKVLLKSDGNKVKLTGRGVYLNVSQNHRILYQKKSKKSKGGWSNWKECTALEFHNKINNKKLRTKYDYRLPHFQDFNGDNERIYIGDDLDLVNKDIVYLVGCLLAEGCLIRCKKGNGFKVSLSQSRIVNEKVYTKIEQSIKNIGNLNFSIRDRNDGVCEWIFDSNSSKRILSWFDKLNIHMMPKWCYGLSQDLAEELIEALMDCDGYWDGMIYTSKRYMLATDFQSIACLAGYRSTKMKKDRNGMYIVCLITKAKKYTYIQDSELWNDGYYNIWCVNTNNGTIITRDQNCVQVSGNCRAMWMMLQQDKSDDYVVSTQETHSVGDFVLAALRAIDVECLYPEDIFNYVYQDPAFMRPAEVNYLLGQSTKARQVLGWKPEVSFEELVKRMVKNDIRENE